nr:hypothetical protein [Pseudomonas sp. HS-2]
MCIRDRGQAAPIQRRDTACGGRRAVSYTHLEVYKRQAVALIYYQGSCLSFELGGTRTSLFAHRTLSLIHI